MSPDFKRIRSILRRMSNALLPKGERAYGRIAIDRFGDTETAAPFTIPSDSRAQLDIWLQEFDPKPVYQTTDFAQLFRRLRTTLRSSWDACLNRGCSTANSSHLDTVIILTDGIHDADNSNPRCATILTQEVIDAYRALRHDEVQQNRDTRIQLVIFPHSACLAKTSNVVNTWERVLGSDHFHVVDTTRFTDDEDLVAKLFAVDSDPPVIRIEAARTSLLDTERQHLDDGEPFWMEYRVMSMPREAMVSIKEATLTPIDVLGATIQYSVGRSPTVASSTDTAFPAGPRRDRHFTTPSEPDVLFFVRKGNGDVDPFGTYELMLKGSVDVVGGDRAADFKATPLLICPTARRQRLGAVRAGLILLMVAWLAGAIALWYRTWRPAQGEASTAELLGWRNTVSAAAVALILGSCYIYFNTLGAWCLVLWGFIAPLLHMHHYFELGLGFSEATRRRSQSGKSD